MTTILWTWRHGALQTQVIDDDWVPDVYWANDSGDCSVEGVEVDGVMIKREALRDHPAYSAYEDAQEQRYLAQAQAARSTTRHVVKVKHPTGSNWAQAHVVATYEEACRLADELRRAVGDDRVRIET